jgi:hypothetical protein
MPPAQKPGEPSAFHLAPYASHCRPLLRDASIHRDDPPRPFWALEGLAYTGRAFAADHRRMCGFYLPGSPETEAA